MSADKNSIKSNIPTIIIPGMCEVGKNRIAVYSQYLKFWDTEMYTVNSMQDIPDEPKEGITLEITQYTIKSSDIEDAPPFIKELLRLSPSAKGTFCKIAYVNYR